MEAFRVRRAADGYIEHWSRDYAEAEAAGVKNPATVAHEFQSWRLELGAETEISQAFNVEREQALAQFAVERPDIAALYVRVWDSALEKNTCDACANAHGSWVPLGDQFPEGTPGDVHNRCQCEDHVEPRDWVDPLARA